MTAVYPQRLPTQSLRHSPHQAQQPLHAPTQRHASKQRFLAEFSQCLFEFIIQLLPTQEELAIKEDVRKLLERLIRTIEPESRLLAFGSTANGFSLRNSDMDLCCLIDSEERLSASDLVTMLGDLLERETKFHVKPLPHARIPIVKLSLDPSPGLPYGIACDIGFENRLALENTRLLMSYALIDPPRVRTMVLFLKVWCKRRKINSPYKGTLSSYGYVLLVIFFLVHVKNPPVLPNLQQMPPLRPISPEETTLHGHNIWFFDDIELLRQRWRSNNTESVAELLVDFFRFYARDFQYNTGVASIRAGLIKKESKGWQSDSDRGTARERNRLCIEDPFETDFNVARCVTRDGLYTIRGELMRASRILASRPERAIVALAQLCEERKDDELLQASPSRLPSSFVPPRLSPLPPQTPYTVGSNPMRPAPPDRLSPPQLHDPPPAFVKKTTDERLPPALLPEQLEHMAPKRGKWTSPPPPEAPEEDRLAFDNQLNRVFAMATASAMAREREREQDTASERSIITDEDFEESRSLAESDDVRSIRSFTDEGAVSFGARSHNGHGPTHHQYQHTRGLTQPFSAVQLRPPPHQDIRSASFVPVQDPSSSRVTYQAHIDNGGPLVDPGRIDPASPSTGRLRGRPFRLGHRAPDIPPPQYQEAPLRLNIDTSSPSKRSLSGGPSPRAPNHRFSMPVFPMYIPGVQGEDIAHSQATQSSHPVNGNHSQMQAAQRASVFYETSPLRERITRAMAAYAANGTRDSDGATPVPITNFTPLNGSPRLSDIGYGADFARSAGPGIQRTPSMESDSTNPSPKQPVVNIPRHVYQDEARIQYQELSLSARHFIPPQQQQYRKNEIPSASTTPLPASSSTSVSTLIPTTTDSLDSDSSPIDPQAQAHLYQRSHSYSHSTATIIAPTAQTHSPQATTVTPALHTIVTNSALGSAPSSSSSPLLSKFPYTLDELTNPLRDRQQHSQPTISQSQSRSTAYSPRSPHPPATLATIERSLSSPLKAHQRDQGREGSRPRSPASDGESRSPSMISGSSSPARQTASVSPISTCPPSPRHSTVKLPPSSAVVVTIQSGDQVQGQSKKDIAEEDFIVVDTLATPDVEDELVKSAERMTVAE